LAERYDAIVVGAGQAGPALAARLDREGLKTALVERKLIGGTCVNVGCIPTKTLVASARAVHMARRGGEYGFNAGDVKVDMMAVKARKDGVVKQSADGLASWIAGMKNVTLIEGQARFTAPRTLDVGGRTLQAGRIFLNVGGRAVVPEIPGIDDVAYLTNSTMMALDRVPEHLVIVGGSYIGLEFAQMYRRFGAKVTIVEMAERLIAREDPDVSDEIRKILEAEGIAVRLNHKCLDAHRHGKDIAIGLECEGPHKHARGSHLLLAVGRVPNTDDLGLDKAGIEKDQRGYIQVDDGLKTTNPRVWALGDCNGKGAFTHTAYNDYEIVADNLLNNAGRKVSDRIPVYALYTDPPLGRAGMSEAEIKKAGIKALVGKRPMTRVARAVEKGETQGFLKIHVEESSKRILGAALLGVGCDEAVHSLIDAIYAKTPYTEFQKHVRIHPTVSELLPTTLENLKPLAP